MPTEQFERNHWAIHQAARGTCKACDKVWEEREREDEDND
jgi:hypothetical protein